MIVRIVPIAPVFSKKLETIWTTGTIGSFHVIVSSASEKKVNDVSGSNNRRSRSSQLSGSFAIVRVALIVPIVWTLGNLRWRRFRGDGNFNRTWRHDLCNIAHALAHHIAVVLPSATWNWSVWLCGENVSYLTFISMIRFAAFSNKKFADLNCPCFLWVTFHARFPSSVI